MIEICNRLLKIAERTGLVSYPEFLMVLKEPSMVSYKCKMARQGLSGDYSKYMNACIRQKQLIKGIYHRFINSSPRAFLFICS